MIMMFGMKDDTTDGRGERRIYVDRKTFLKSQCF